MTRTQRTGANTLRIAVALLLMIHGIARISLGIVGDFGVFLTMNNIAFGWLVAWIITVVEIGGGAVLALGFFVTPLCGWFAIQLAVGIAMVHLEEGWFVVGAGRNGMEYSVLLIVALVAIAMLHRPDASDAKPPDSDDG